MHSWPENVACFNLVTMKRFVIVHIEFLKLFPERSWTFTDKKIIDQRSKRTNDWDCIRWLRGCQSWFHTGINLSVYNQASNPSMINQILSDEETIDQYSSPTLEHLLNENKMKDLALSKATNLIELLNIELQVERNSHQESMRQLEIQLGRKYQTQMRRLRDRMAIMERELGKIGPQSTEKTMRQTSFSRASSVRSFQNRKKHSINKKYTENQTVQSAEKQDHNPKSYICDMVFRQQLLEMQEWKEAVVVQLSRIIKEQYDDLASFINQIEACSEDFQGVVLEKPQKQRDMIGEMGSIIREQQGLINCWRAYAQDLQDIYKSSFFKIMTVNSLQPEEKRSAVGWLDESVEEVRRCAQRKRGEWQAVVSGLEGQNGQLKSILESMIKLVKQQKSIRV